MTTTPPISGALPPAALPLDKPQASRAQLAAAAQKFEAIFVRQMLASARKASFGDALFGSSAGDTFREQLDARFADVAAQRGALGLAKQIEAQLAGRVDLPSRLREGPGVGQSEPNTAHVSTLAHPQPLPQAGGESFGAGGH